MAVLDLTPESDDDANQSLVEYLKTPQAQAASAKLSESVSLAHETIAKALGNPLLDSIAAMQQSALGGLAESAAASVASLMQPYTEGVLASVAEATRSPILDGLSSSITSLTAEWAKSIEYEPFGVAAILRGLAPHELAASGVLGALRELSPPEPSVYASLLAPTYSAPPEVPMLLERRIDDLEDDVAELRRRVRRVETRAQRAETRARSAETVAKEAKLRLAQALPPLWAGEPTNDSDHPADQVN